MTKKNQSDNEIIEIIPLFDSQEFYKEILKINDLLSENMNQNSIFFLKTMLNVRLRKLT
jgi:hypothetical protein